MRHLSVIVVLFLACHLAFSQEKNQRISLFADLDVELPSLNNFIGTEYQYSFTSRSNLGAFLGFDEGSLYTLGVDYIYDFPLIGEKLEFKIGGGVNVFSYKNSENSRTSLKCLSGNAGFAFNWGVKYPFSTFAMWRPKVELFSFDAGEVSSIRFGIGYRF